jgi:O-antigen/teichoic acid export membrane protein
LDQNKKSFNRAALLTASRIIGILFSISIPMYLGRHLSIETYGTYKQLMLLFWFAHVALNLGLDDSAYFFLQKDPQHFPLYCFNALLFNLFFTAILWLLLHTYKIEISSLVGNRVLAQYLPLMGYLIMATVCSMQIEGMLIVGLNRFNERLAIEILTELLKSLAILIAFYFFNSLFMALIFLSAIMTFRLLATVSLIHRCKIIGKLSYRDAPKYLPRQLSFGLPLGLSRILQNILNMENFFISSFFSLAQFTFYTVGCFENPLVNAARTSIFELANIDMTDAINHNDLPKAIAVWNGMTRKLFLIIIPFVIYMIFFSREIIIFIFSIKYIPSIPFFMVFNLYLIVGALNPEPIFRATSKTFLAFKIRFLGLIVGILLLVGGAYLGGPLYALAGKILGVFIMNVTGLVYGARLLKSNILNLFQWRDLASVTFLSLILSIGLKLTFANLTWYPFWILAFSFSSFVVLHFIFSCWINLIKDDEIYYLKLLFRRFVLNYKSQ